MCEALRQLMAPEIEEAVQTAVQEATQVATQAGQEKGRQEAENDFAQLVKEDGVSVKKQHLPFLVHRVRHNRCK